MIKRYIIFATIVVVITYAIVVVLNSPSSLPKQGKVKSAETKPLPKLDTVAYNKKLNAIANNQIIASSTTSTVATL